MIAAIIENQETKSKEYLYVKNENNILFYYGFSFIDNEITPIDKNIIQKIYNLFKLNEECIYIEDYLNYQVYLDKKNNIKHFIKNGVEDFLMLFDNNGQDIAVYNKSSDIEKNISKSKKIHIGKFIISISLNFIILMTIYNMSTPIIQAKLREGNVYNNLQYKFSQIAYSVSDYIGLDIKSIDSNQALELIKNSDLPDDLKECFSNEDLINNIFPYYKNTDMEYLIKSKLQNLKLRVYEPTDKLITNPETTDGFYIELAPNVLNVKNISKYKETAKHEFVHLLQSPNRKYIFLQEALAEIISEEYLDKKDPVYGYCVMSVSLLMDTIGPKIIWETVFSGDDTNLKNVLKSNLDGSEYNELISYLTTPPQETVESCRKINEIISNLYKNINNQEIRENKNIFNEYGYHVKRIYFNEDKMLKKQTEDGFININEIFTDQVVRENKNIVR